MNKGYKRFIEENLEIVDKNGNLVPFKLNKIQDKFLSQDTSNRRDIILKARQQGFSSLILGMFLADFLLKENVYNVVVADDVENAKGLLKRVKDYLKSYGHINGIDMNKMLKYNSKYELYIEPLNNTYQIGTAQNTQFGRSRTITNLHLSEAAFYPHLSDIFAGALQAVVPEGRVIIETTANGFNDFKKFWDESEAGLTPFKTHFYKGSEFYSEGMLQEKYQELKALGKERLFRQEYPETPHEAFITSGDPYFNPDALDIYLKGCRNPMEENLIYV